EGARIACIDGFAGIGVEKGVKAAREALRRGRMAEVYGNFAGVEAGEKKLHLFRDHFGVKPMYFAKKGNVVYFGSELKTFTSLAVKNVKLVKPGEIVTVESGKIRRQRYYLLKYREQGMEIEFALKKLKKLIEEAVQFAMPENGRTAALLSGGLDSSCIVWFAAKKMQLETFVAGYEDGSEDVEISQKFAEFLGINHNVVHYGLKEMLEVLPDVIYHLESFDFALVRSAIPNYIVVRNTNAHNLLSGEGGDEIFAGYSYLEKVNERDLGKELNQLLYTAHNNAFQRDDRMFSAHCVECILPFLYLPLVEFGFRIPAGYKINNGVRKWILRNLLKIEGVPDYIVNREKRKFSDGAGSMFALEKFVESEITDREFKKESSEANVRIRNKEELFYYRIFLRYFPDVWAWDSLLGFTKRTER
ncbi:MAG: asparagine synthase-related protein, partial [Thermoplasmata archaeon]